MMTFSGLGADMRLQSSMYDIYLYLSNTTREATPKMLNRFAILKNTYYNILVGVFTAFIMHDLLTFSCPYPTYLLA